VRVCVAELPWPLSAAFVIPGDPSASSADHRDKDQGHEIRRAGSVCNVMPAAGRGGQAEPFIDPRSPAYRTGRQGPLIVSIGALCVGGDRGTDNDDDAFIAEFCQRLALRKRVPVSSSRFQSSRSSARDN
jgi:hypothetical protein